MTVIKRKGAMLASMYAHLGVEKLGTVLLYFGFVDAPDDGSVVVGMTIQTNGKNPRIS
jgi:hypothetical protein